MCPATGAPTRASPSAAEPASAQPDPPRADRRTRLLLPALGVPPPRAPAAASLRALASLASLATLALAMRPRRGTAYCMYKASDLSEVYLWTLNKASKLASMQAALMIRAKSRERRKQRLKRGIKAEIPSNVATKPIAPFPRYPPTSWVKLMFRKDVEDFRLLFLVQATAIIK
ncbi:unnamed protein product [Colias eurytheme]|nr:unnamed protein product [Colias eurytheme]